jgi:hypothetical protein
MHDDERVDIAFVERTRRWREGDQRRRLGSEAGRRRLGSKAEVGKERSKHSVQLGQSPLSLSKIIPHADMIGGVSETRLHLREHRGTCTHSVCNYRRSLQEAPAKALGSPRVLLTTAHLMSLKPAHRALEALLKRDLSLEPGQLPCLADLEAALHLPVGHR